MPWVDITRRVVRRKLPMEAVVGAVCAAIAILIIVGVFIAWD